VAKRKEFNAGAAVAAVLAFVVLAVGGLIHFGVIDAPSGSGSGAPSATKPKDGPPKQDGGSTVQVTGYDEDAAAKDYPGDPDRSLLKDHPERYRAQQVKVARWMADWAEKAGLPRELPVMAALQESSMYNNPGGDRDSAGYFQMRAGIWMKQYPDYPHRPARQLKWFITKAIQVRGSHKSWNGDSSRWGDWIVAIELPDERYRYRYQERLPEARELLKG
jgi:hypothetical protein